MSPRSRAGEPGDRTKPRAISATRSMLMTAVPGTWGEALSRLENNEIDILCTIAFSEDRDKIFDFTKENLLTNWGQLYTLIGSNIKAITDVAGRKVAVLKGDIHYKIFTQILDRFGIECEKKSISVQVPKDIEEKIISTLNQRLSGLVVHVNGNIAIS